MTAKEWLSRARFVDVRLAEKVERLDRLREKLESGRHPQLSGMPRGGQSDWVDALAAYLELEKRINAEKSALMREYIQIKDAIDQVDDARYRAILEHRYIDGWTWEQIAEQMHYDVRHVHRLHGLALLEIKVPGE